MYRVELCRRKWWWEIYPDWLIEPDENRMTGRRWIIDADDDTYAPHVFKREVHDWLVERDIHYKIFYTKENEDGSKTRNPDMLYTLWLEMEEDFCVLFKLTWGGM